MGFGGKRYSQIPSFHFLYSERPHLLDPLLPCKSHVSTTMQSTLPQNPFPLMLMDCRSATCMTLMPLLARRAMPSGQIASMATTLVAMRADGVAPPAPSAEALVSMEMAETSMATLLGVPPFLFWWVLMCLERWSLLMKRFGHSGQANFFSPEEIK